MKIGWICLSGIGKSETFLTDTLADLKSISKVEAVSGVSNGLLKHDPEHLYIPFAEKPLRLIDTLARKLTGRNVHRQQLQRRCWKMTKEVWEAFRPDVFWIEFGTTAVVSKDLLKATGRPYVVAVHGYDITTQFKDAEYKEQLVELLNSDRCKAIVCASEYTKRLCVLAGVNPSKLVVIRLGLDADEIKPNGSVKTEHPSFVHFGRLVEKKNPIATFEAFRIVSEAIPDATLSFIGDGPLETELRERVNAAGLEDRVRLWGGIDRSEALSKVRVHWVFVQHSVTAKSGDQEGFALSPAEAALLEMPVVSTLHNGIPEHVIHGKTGYLVNEFDYEAMAERMIELASDEALRNQFGKAGRLNVSQMCDPEKRRIALRQLVDSIR